MTDQAKDPFSNYEKHKVRQFIPCSSPHSQIKKLRNFEKKKTLLKKINISLTCEEVFLLTGVSGDPAVLLFHS